MVNHRMEREKLEEIMLFDYGVLVSASKGRKYREVPCDLRTDFQRDRDRIIHSKSFRRLKHKTQVFIAPEGDHFRTRLTHTLEVAQIARTIARSLRLNEDLVEAIALGHDLGHTPFGHSGEAVLNQLNPRGFKHADQSLRVVDLLEQSKNRQGLNLTWEVRDGIVNHTGGDQAETLEGQIIKFADRIAYINHDIDDAIRAGIIREEDLPKDLIKILGTTGSKRIDRMIHSIVTASYGKGVVEMESEIYEATMALRQFMFQRVYLDPVVKSQDEKIHRLLTELFHYYKDRFDLISADYLKIYESGHHSKEDIICDYIAGMTDTYAISQWKSIFVPKGWSVEGQLCL
ncbi:MAG: deoxyguanosinetriphosphate triphosphohydrolase [Tissierellia bacterium]|nr:deoxyguanosinetriphosphate triphosphohydrolase [Tissierellia bacterium]